MKTVPAPRSSSGSVLLVALFFVSLISLGAAALVKASQGQTAFAARSTAWERALPIADAGVAEALSHLNDSSSRETNGWRALGNAGWRKSRSFAGGSYTVTIANKVPPIISSTGEVPADGSSHPVARTIVVQTRISGSARIEVAGAILCSSAGAIDAYDSSNPSFSTGGLYDPLKCKDTAVVASLSGPINIGSRQIYGWVDQGTPGPVTVGNGGKVGDAQWIARSDTVGQVQPGHFRTNYVAQYNATTPPFTNGSSPLSLTLGTNSYKYVFLNGDYSLNTFSLNGSEKGIVSGNTRLYVAGNFTISGGAQLEVAPGASLQIFCNGSTLTISGGGIVNQSQRPRNVAIYGTQNLTRADISGSASFHGRIDAPAARLTLSGGSSFFGALKANTLIISGSNQLHLDHSLENRYLIASWRES